MAVNSVSSGDSLTYVSNGTEEKKSSTSLDPQAFLTLLVAQLKYQDPLSPQNDTAFVTQLAQMSSLQEMENMNATLKNSQAYDMVGKQVYAEVLDKTTGVVYSYFGVVDSVVISNGLPYVVVGSTAISVADVLEVLGPPAEQPEAPDTETPVTETPGTPTTEETGA